MSEKLPADDYLKEKLEDLERSLPDEKFLRAYAFSMEMQEHVKAKRFTEQDLLDSFKKYLDPTRGRHLIKLHTVGIRFVQKCQRYFAELTQNSDRKRGGQPKGAKRLSGMSYSHLLYAMQKNNPDEIRELLNWSMDKKATMARLRKKAKGRRKVRPSIQIARIRRTVGQLNAMLDALAGETIVTAINGMDPTRRSQAGKNLVAIWKCLNKTIKGNKLGKASRHLEKSLKRLGKIS